MTQQVNKNGDGSFEMILCSDHDFKLFKDLRFKPWHEIWVSTTTRGEGGGGADDENATISYNSGQNLRHRASNLLSLGLFLSTFAYVTYVYQSFSKTAATSLLQ